MKFVLILLSFCNLNTYCIKTKGLYLLSVIIMGLLGAIGNVIVLNFYYRTADIHSEMPNWVTNIIYN